MKALSELRLWEAGTPFAEPDDATKPEHIEMSPNGILRLTDVTVPTITFYPASGRGPKPAVLVCPGGGYTILAWNHEGRDICGMLNLNGFSAFLLKYRCHRPDSCAPRAAAHADAARAMRLIRARAKEFDIIPNKLGIIGFSAGGHLAATLCAPADPVPYPAADEADKLPYRPDFAAMIYPAYLVRDDGRSLQPEFKVTADVPPTFLVQAEDDDVKVENSLVWYRELKDAGVPAEMHLYPTGNHGYGLLRTGDPISEWGMLAGAWFRRQAGLK